MEMNPDYKWNHDLMALTLDAMYPHLSQWVDYKVSHPIDKATNGQGGNPEIMEWATAEPKPEYAEVEAFFLANRERICAQYVRIHREDRLTWSDRYAVIPSDAPPSVVAKYEAWIDYRQALRDMTEQPGFPCDVVWPEVPGDEAMKARAEWASKVRTAIAATTPEPEPEPVALTPRSYVYLPFYTVPLQPVSTAHSVPEPIDPSQHLAPPETRL